MGEQSSCVLEDALLRGRWKRLYGTTLMLNLCLAGRISAQDFGTPAESGSTDSAGTDAPPAETSQPETPTGDKKAQPRPIKSNRRSSSVKGKGESASNPDAAVRSDGKSKSESTQKPESTSGSETSTLVKGQVRGILGNRLQLNIKNFSDIATGQIFIIEGKTPGQILAHIEIVQVSRNKRSAAAKINKLESGLELTELLNLFIYREKDFKAKYTEANITSLVAPDALAGRNNMFGIRLNFSNSIPPAANLVTGVALNQSVTHIGSSVDFFVPQFGTTRWPNKLGLHVSYMQSIPVSIIGRVSGSEETQALKLTSSDLKIGLVFKTRPSTQALSEFWVSTGYQILNTKASVESSVGSGSTDITFAQKGPELGLGGDFSPLPFLYLGADLLAGIPQKYSGSDSTNSASRSGTWNQFRTGLFSELRYPVGRTKTSVLSIQIKGGATIDQIEVQESDKKRLERPINPFFSARIGFSAG